VAQTPWLLEDWKQGKCIRGGPYLEEKSLLFTGILMGYLTTLSVSSFGDDIESNERMNDE
jgi:hypothetical protein